ncbi:prolyl oligopeptidase family serine peptidase [Gammaproteobacteria bacterium]|jgi:oligopeptidase B|nr:prolyl oligopeptidase family serine peptidase [Gammaproteobacteria bacterium]
MGHRVVSILLVALQLLACDGQSSSQLVPPVAAKIPIELTIHGDTRIDNYYWLNQRNNPDVIAYLEEENRYAENVMAQTVPLQEILFVEFKARLPEKEETAPFKFGDYFYYLRQLRDKDYPVYYRRKGSPEGSEQLLLDVNELAKDHAYFSVSGFTISPDNRYAVYGVDTVGRRLYTMQVIDLETGERLADTVENIVPVFAWVNDSKTFYFVRQNLQTLNYERVYRHTLGGTEDELIYSEPDETFSVSVEKSLSRKYVYLNVTSTVSTEVHVLDASDPTATPRLIEPRSPNHEYQVTDGGDRFYIRSNDRAENFKVMEAPLNSPSRENWTPLVEHRSDVLLERVTAFRDYLAIDERANGLTRLTVLDRSTGEQFVVGQAEPAYTVQSSSNYEFDSAALRYRYESFTRPSSVYDFDFESRQSTLIKQTEIAGGFDPDNYAAERFFVTARDGAAIPVEIVYRKGMERNSETPVWQYGYGAYGAVYDPWFSATRLSMLDRGFIFVLTHVRGGSELGRQWYLDGRQLKKKNSFNDFIDVSRYLIDQGYTSREHLYAEGGSAGGLLIGAVANMAPDLYRGINAGLAFVDVVTTMLDDTIPLTALEWDEWGNPSDDKYYAYMLSYSPYDQVRAMNYPNMLLTAGLHDSQVQYWEPAKWAAKLRELKTDENLLILKTDMNAGHSGRIGRLQALRDTAFEYAFFLNLEGILE